MDKTKRGEDNVKNQGHIAREEENQYYSMSAYSVKDNENERK